MPADKAPTDKLPLAVRKNVRDEWENKKVGYESELTALLSTPWKVEINPNAIYPYAEIDSFGHNSLGACIAQYVEGAIYYLKYHVGRDGDSLKDEINAVCTTHTITLIASDAVNYNGCDVVDGVLRMLFGPTNLGTNIGSCFERLPKVISDAPQPAGAPGLSFAARHSVKTDYDSKIGPLLEKARKLLENPELKFEPGFEENGKLLKGGKDVRDDWETNMGNFTYSYYESFVEQLERDKFGDDDMLREGFAEAVPSGVVKFQIVPTMQGYNGLKLADDALFMQTTPGNFGTNISQTCEKLVDSL